MNIIEELRESKLNQIATKLCREPDQSLIDDLPNIYDNASEHDNRTIIDLIDDYDTLTTMLDIYENEGLRELCYFCIDNDYCTLTSEGQLKYLLINEIKDSVPNWVLISHYIEGLQEESEIEFYNYDTSMGTLDSITPVNDLDDLCLEEYF